MVNFFVPRCLLLGDGILFNCWNILKLTKLQREDEISLGANVAKAEKIG